MRQSFGMRGEKTTLPVVITSAALRKISPRVRRPRKYVRIKHHVSSNLSPLGITLSNPIIVFSAACTLPGTARLDPSPERARGRLNPSRATFYKGDYTQIAVAMSIGGQFSCRALRATFGTDVAAPTEKERRGQAAPQVRWRSELARRSSRLNCTAAFRKPRSQEPIAGPTSWSSAKQLQRLLKQTNWKALDMKKAVLALATAATIAVTALAIPSPAEARWRGGGWGPGLAGGLIAGAVIGGIASNAYAYGPGYGYYGGPGYGYYGGYAPAYYDGYAPAYYGTMSYAPAYYGPRYRRVIRQAYAYGGPRYYRGHRYRW
jgi:hypothetical protein